MPPTPRGSGVGVVGGGVGGGQGHALEALKYYYY